MVISGVIAYLYSRQKLEDNLLNNAEKMIWTHTQNGNVALLNVNKLLENDRN